MQFQTLPAVGTLFPSLKFTKPTNAGRHDVKVSYAEFRQNRTINLGNADRNLLPRVSSASPSPSQRRLLP